MKSRIGLLLGATLVSAGCNQSSLVGVPSTRVETRQQIFQEPLPGKVDILWVIDDSGSMGAEQALVANGFQAFANEFAGLGLDFHLAVTSMDPRASADPGALVGNPPFLTAATMDLGDEFIQRAMLGTDGGPREAGLETAQLALSEPMLSGPNAGFLRDDAILAILFLTDEDDQSLLPGQPEPSGADVDDPFWREANLAPVQGFVDNFLALKDGNPEMLFAAAIVGDPIGDPYDLDSTGCGDAEGGFRYAAAATAMGGYWRSICGGAVEFRDMLEEIAGEITPTESLPKEFATDFEPMPGSVSVTVDGVPVPEDPATGWHWEPGVGVVFSDAAVPPVCASIEITYSLPPGIRHAPPEPQPAAGCE